MLLCTEVRLKTAGTMFGSVWRRKKNHLYLCFIVKSCMHLCSLLSESFTLSWFLVSLIYLYKVPEIEPSRCHSSPTPYFEFLLKSHGPIIPCVHARLAEGQHGHSGIKFKFQLVLQAVCKAKGHYYPKEAKEPEWKINWVFWSTLRCRGRKGSFEIVSLSHTHTQLLITTDETSKR